MKGNLQTKSPSFIRKSKVLMLIQFTKKPKKFLIECVLEKKIRTLYEKETFLSVKDHEGDFWSCSSFRFINLMTECGVTSRVIIQYVCDLLRIITQINQCQGSHNTSHGSIILKIKITWFLLNTTFSIFILPLTRTARQKHWIMPQNLLILNSNIWRLFSIADLYWIKNNVAIMALTCPKVHWMELTYPYSLEFTY